jgi:hypothetical protein
MEAVDGENAGSEGLGRVLRDKRFVTYVLTLTAITCWRCR